MSVPFGFGQPDPDKPGQPAFDMASLGAALQSLGQMLASGSNTPGLSSDMVSDLARKAIVGRGDPTPTAEQRQAVSDAIRLAEVWLDGVTTLPGGAREPVTWSRSEWLIATLPAWLRYVAPIADQMRQGVAGLMTGPDGQLGTQDLQAMFDELPEQFRGMFPGGIPPEMSTMLGPLLGMMQQLGSVAFTMQLSQVLAGLAGEVVSATDIGIPLVEDPWCALIPVNVREFGDGIGVNQAEVLLYLALREAAHQRLFAHVAWLRPRIVGAIEEYARGMRLDADQINDAMREVDISQPQAIQEALAQGLLRPVDTPEQQSALARLQTLLALIEGWVEDTVHEATRDRLESADALRETMRRRRAAGGPGEKAFATLVGMELRPRAIREAATIFGALRVRGSVEQRDGLWAHPDLLPTPEDLMDPLGFVDTVLHPGEQPNLDSTN
ncbi:MAG: zinc-dependent metalloprotease [Actinomycetales bacterium]